MRKPLALLALLAGLTVRPTAARACECVDPGFSLQLPRDGATGVPTNARVVVTAERLGLDRWVGTDPQRTPVIALVPVPKKKGQKKGKPVKALVGTLVHERWGTIVTAQPEKPLEPNTTYEVVLQTGPKPARWKPVSTFTTGAAADTAPPVFAGLDRFTAVVSFRSPVSKCDGQPPFPELTWKYPAATDDTTAAGDLLRILYIQKKGEPRQVRLIEAVDATRPVTNVSGGLCDPFRVTLQPGDEVCATVEVVDLAGNVAGAAVEKCMVARKL